MELIGNILKNTAKVGYKRQVKKSQKLKDQNYTLQRLLFKARLTDFGLAHNFSEILDSDLPSSAFRKTVPLTNYEQFYNEWLSQSLDDKRNITWPGRIPFYALSSGTTNSPSKRIPVTESMLRQFQRTSLKQVIGIHELHLPSSFFESQALIIGGSTELVKVKHHFEGDLSGILAKNKSFVLTPFTKPRRKISKLKDWNTKMKAIVEKADQWDIGVIAGVPSWITLLLEEIVRHYNLESIHDIWPNFSIYSHGGIFLDPYKERLDRLFAKPVYYQNTYLASEGYFAFQKNFFESGMDLLLSNGVYFEFIEEKYFDKIQNAEFKDIPTLNIDEVQPNTPYAIVISTCSGLWRYVLGDVVEFIDLENKRINIIGRVSFTMSIVGEHISDGNMIQAIKKVSERLNIVIEEFCAHPNTDGNQHNWYVGVQQPDKLNPKVIAEIIDKELKEMNDDYASVRKYTLEKPQVEVVNINQFYYFMEKRGKLGGQNKFPRVLKPEMAEEWMEFLDI